MRDAMGGSILFYIILGFIGIFIVFIAIIMNYASAYRTNNYVVNMIEQTEGTIEFDSNSRDSLVGYLKSNNYYNGLNVTCNSNTNGSVYHVTTYIKFYIPLIDVGFPIAINNDTKTIFNVYCDSNDSRYDRNKLAKGYWKGEN